MDHGLSTMDKKKPNLHYKNMASPTPFDFET